MDDTAEAVHIVGHRRFVGGTGEFWNQIGALQFKLLIERGLKPSDTFLDVGCGSLRGGCQFIRYLNERKYLGVEKYIELIIYGVCQELGIEEYARKQPQFFICEAFEFEKFGQKVNYGIAQSLFTHLCERDLRKCLARLRAVAAPACRFFATFFEAESPTINDQASHSHRYFGYTRSQLEHFGIDAGWQSNYIGEWGHPRGQRLIEYYVE